MYCTSLPVAYYDTESADRGGDRTEGEGRGKEGEQQPKTKKQPTPPCQSYWCVRGGRAIQGHPLVASTTTCLFTGIYVHSGRLYTLGGNEWFRFPRHSLSGSTLLGLTWDSWCGKGTGNLHDGHSQTVEFCSYSKSMTCLKPSGGVENEAKDGFIY